MKLLDVRGKSAAIRAVAADHPTYTTFIETGTAWGVLTEMLAPHFSRVGTIEADRNMYESASVRLRPYPHVQCIHGDSGRLLGSVLAACGPTIIFLDAHEISDAGDSALAAELAHIAAAKIPPLVMVDDARLCSDARGWVSVDSMVGWAEQNGYTFLGVHDDIVTMVPDAP